MGRDTGWRSRGRSIGAAITIAVPLAFGGGCGKAPSRSHDDAAAIAAARARSRPIGVGPRFHSPPPRRAVRDCRPALGPRIAAHLELFAADRVVLIPAGIGTEPPRRLEAGRIVSARCYGPVVTLEPTGLILVRPDTRPRLLDLFRAWGKPLSPRRMGDFTAPRNGGVAAFVGGRRWRKAPGDIPLARHAVIVLEVGPFVPPHRMYRFPRGF
jgi:hypothetical protein